MNSLIKSSLIVWLIFTASAVPVFSETEPGDISAKIRHLVRNGTVILHDESGSTLFSLNADSLFVPASIIKVLTSQIALDLLGEDFHFTTECYRRGASDIVLKGCGDPFLISDEIRLFAQQLKTRGISHIGRLFLDHSEFSDDLSIPGISATNNPYDALNGALVVNFNTINVGKDSSGSVVSAEKETPLTALAREKGASLARKQQQRINLSADKNQCKRYAAELVATIFREQGIIINDSAAVESAVSSSDSLLFVHKNSKSLPVVLQGLLKYSNNFIANQLFLTIGIQKNGFPATMAKSTAVFESYIRNTLKIPETELVQVEGSGISRENKVTGNVMISIMEKFKPHVALLTPKNGHPVKSGTLNCVSNYAGYIKTDNGLRAFVIMLNQEKSTRDEIMKLLESF